MPAVVGVCPDKKEHFAGLWTRNEGIGRGGGGGEGSERLPQGGRIPRTIRYACMCVIIHSTSGKTPAVQVFVSVAAKVL